MDRVQDTVENSFVKHIESVKKDVFEIFSQMTTDKSESKIVTIDNELDSLRSQMRELRMRNQESFQ